MNTLHTMRWLTGCLFIVLAGCSDDALDPVDGAFVEGPPIAPLDGKSDGLAQDIPAYAALPPFAQLDVSFEALFAPDDPVNTVEVQLINDVIAAREADDERYDEGANPYRIRYAVYNLRNPAVVARLIAAEAAGVDVQVLIDAHQLDPAKTWNTADETLIAAGFEFVADHADLDDATRVSADLVGIKRSGLMHLKARLFETPDDAVLLTGSLNPGDNAMLNEETLHLVRDAHLINRYATAYTSIRDGERYLDNAFDPNRAVNVMFTPARGDRAIERLFDWIADEQEQILIMCFSLRDIEASNSSQSLVELLGAKASSGVPVYVITDRKQSDGVDADGNRLYYNDATEDRLRNAGVVVYEATNRASPYTAMHHKVGIFGKSRIRVVTDAANWTKAGLGKNNQSARNMESQLFIDSALLDDNRTGRRYLAQWLRVLSRYAHQSPESPSFEEVRDTLVGSADWPQQPVRFEVDVETEFGELVHVRGDLDALSRWDYPGFPLATDADWYPTWISDEPLMAPVGATFEWKLAAGFDEWSVRWESGDNRTTFAQPTALLGGAGTLVEGSWRR